MLKKILVSAFLASFAAASAGCFVESRPAYGRQGYGRPKGPRNLARCGPRAHWDPGVRACVLDGSRGRVITSN